MRSEWCSEALCFTTEYSQFQESLQLSEKQKALLDCTQFARADSQSHSMFKADHNTLDAKQLLRIVSMMQCLRST